VRSAREVIAEIGALKIEDLESKIGPFSFLWCKAGTHSWLRERQLRADSCAAGCTALFSPIRVLSEVICRSASMVVTVARRCRREPKKVLSECLFGPMRVCFSIVAKRVVVAVLMLYTKARLYKREKAAKAEASDTRDEAKSTLTYFQKAEASYNRIRSSCNPGQYMMSINRGLTSSLHHGVTVFLQQCLKGFAVRFPQRCVPSAHA